MLLTITFKDLFDQLQSKKHNFFLFIAHIHIIHTKRKLDIVYKNTPKCSIVVYNIQVVCLTDN